MLIDGRASAANLRHALADRIATLRTKGVEPKLVILQVGNDPRTQQYVAAKQRAATEIGIIVDCVNSVGDEPSLETHLKSIIQEMNRDTAIHGIILQLPVPDSLNDQSIIDTIAPEKDVDGLTTANQQALQAGAPAMLPATPQAVLWLLTDCQVALKGASVAVVGQGRLVGRTLTTLLRQAGATVSTANSKTIDLAAVTKSADIVISAVGKPNLITPEHIRPGVVLIDVGLTDVDSKLVGDISPQAKALATLATPVPGGVGPMTVVSLLANVVKAAEDEYRRRHSRLQ